MIHVAQNGVSISSTRSPCLYCYILLNCYSSKEVVLVVVPRWWYFSIFCQY